MTINYMNILLYLCHIGTVINMIYGSFINSIEYSGISWEKLLLIFMHNEHMDKFIKIY